MAGVVGWNEEVGAELKIFGLGLVYSFTPEGQGYVAEDGEGYLLYPVSNGYCTSVSYSSESFESAYLLEIDHPSIYLESRVVA